MAVESTLTIARQGTPYSLLTRGLGGLNNSVADELIADDELSDVSNYVLDTAAGGVIVKREGLTKKFQTPLTEAVTSVHDGVQNDYFSTSTKVFSLDGTERVSGLTSTTNPDWTSFNNKDLYVDGTNAPRVTSNGTTFSNLGGSPPTFKFIQAFNNMVFGAGHDKGRLRWSAFGDETVWPSVNELIITNAEDDDITALKRFRNVLVILCLKSFYHVQGFGETDVSVTYSSFEEGATSHRSIVVSPYGLFWWSKNGPVHSDGQVVSYIGKRRIPRTIDALNRDQYTLVHGLWNPLQERIEWFVFNTTSTTINKKIYYYPRIEVSPGEFKDAWFIGEGNGVLMGASGVVIESGKAKVFVGSASTSGYVYEQTGTDDDGTAIGSYLETKRQAPISLNSIKRIKKLTPIVVSGGAASVRYGVYLDNSTTLTKSYDLSTAATPSGFILNVSNLNEGVLGGGAETKPIPIGFAHRYQKIKHRISDSSNIAFKIHGVINEGYLIRG